MDGAPSNEKQISHIVEKIVRFGGFANHTPNDVAETSILREGT